MSTKVAPVSTGSEQLMGPLSVSAELAAVLQDLLASAMQVLDAEMGRIDLYDLTTGSMTVATSKGFPEPYLKYLESSHRTATRDGPNGIAFGTRSRVVIGDLDSDPRMQPALPIAELAGIKSMQATPLLSRAGEPVGEISTYSRMQLVPSAERLHILDLYARLAADAIEHEQDLAERDKTEFALRESEEGFRRLYELMVRLSATESLEAALSEVLRAAIALVHADAGHIRLLDRKTGEYAFVAQTGFKEDLLLRFGTKARDFFARAPAVEAIEKAQRIIVEDIEAYPPSQPHLEIVRAVGFASLQATPLFNHAGKPVGSICTFFASRHVPSDGQLRILDLYARLAADTIDRQDQREEQANTEIALRRAITVKDEFLGLVSHELRTPLTVIRGISSVLKRNPDLPKDALEESYADLSVESERLYRLIENMLMLARVKAGQKQQTELVLVDKLLGSSAARLRNELPEAVLELMSLPRDVILQVVSNQVEQILQNLVENAYKYSPRGSVIQLGAIAEDAWVQIFVADRGIGLKDPEVLFQPFKREEEAEKLAPGMGLGLAVCRTLVEAQSGRIWAEPREGGGSVFWFTLPR